LLLRIRQTKCDREIDSLSRRPGSRYSPQVAARRLCLSSNPQACPRSSTTARFRRLRKPGRRRFRPRVVSPISWNQKW